MVNLIPMAGEGKRFLNEGYLCPKPFIQVSGKPMVVQAAQSLPKAQRWVFVCRQEHLKDYLLDQVLRKYLSSVEIIAIDYLTKGQAETCLLAEHIIGNDEELLVGPCDSGAIWDQDKYNDLILSGQADALIWTFRNNVTVKRNPKMYGWVRVDNRDNAIGVSCKVPLSENPYKDHAVVGTFYFRKASYFFNGVKKMISAGHKVNNEFYVDDAMNVLINAGLKVKIFEVDKYICWGTPSDLKIYQYWENYFKKKHQENH